MTHLSLISVLTFISCSASAAVVFSDDFNRAALGASYVTTVSGGDGGAAISGNSFLELTNDASDTANANGRVSTAVSFADFSAPFSGTLSTNAGLVTWDLNLRFNRTSHPSGYGNGLYAPAFVLAASQADFTGGFGYAIVYGNPNTPDPIRLVRYSGGLVLDTNLTNIINTSNSSLAAVNNYASVRVTFDPVAQSWSLFARDDGAAAWSSPMTLSEANRLGVATVDTAHTDSALTHAGVLWNYSTAAGQTAQFDNLQVAVVPEMSTLYPMLGAATGLLLLRRRAKARTQRHGSSIRIS